MSQSPTARARLRVEIEKRFLPLLQDRGFAGPTKLNGNRILHEFTRPAASGTHELSIQFDKYQRPRAVINLAIVPLGGFERLEQVGGTLIQGRATWRSRGVMTGSWFRADRPLWQRLLGRRSTTEAEAVAAMISCLPEIDHWWDAQQESQHIRVWSHTYTVPK